MSDRLETLRALSAIPGVSGTERAVREEILRRIEGCYESAETDPLGNLIVFKRGKAAPRNSLLFSAHMDEVGLIVTFIEETGLLRFAPIGGIDSRTVFGRAVEIGQKRIPGVIGGKATHQLSSSEGKEPPKFDKLCIDIGAAGRQEAEALVSPGDRAVFSGPLLELGEDMILGRAFDDRAGCALLVGLIRSELPCDCSFSFTVQEETGCVGAMTAGFNAGADICVAVETTTAGDVAGSPPAEEVAKLGGGPVISFMDKGTVYDPELYSLAFAVAGREKIACQPKTAVAGGNESRSLQTAGRGARVLAVSLPCRYLHTPSCVLHKGDIDMAGRLLCALIPALGEVPAKQ
ncbi:MAG: M42 family peptidase [Oscillospiraceae bacterium]|jgi:endoglucanase|nr:M42 family peptidase [Oscillospiraceae bacterium]